MVYQHTSCHFSSGFVKMAWLSTQQKQSESPICLAHQKGSNLFLFWNLVTSLVQTSNSLIKLRSWGHTRLQSHYGTQYQGFIQLLLLSYSIVQANLFILRWWYDHFCRVCTGFIASRSGKFHLVWRSFEAYKSPSAHPECAGKSRYLSASIHLSTLIRCITPKPPLATHWMSSTFQTGHLGL